MEQIIRNLYTIELEKFKCPICHDTAFPPVKLFVQKPATQHTPVCNHIYCLDCIRTYFQLNKKISDRNVNRYECLLCQQKLILGSTISGVPKNANDVYYHCSSDDCRIIEILVQCETTGNGRKCPEKNCEFRSCSPEEMRTHCRNVCEFTKIKCIYPKCTFYNARNLVHEHEQVCKFKPLQCKLCDISKNYNDLLYHYNHFHKILNVFDRPFLLE
jgi:hypothetical protein